MRKNKLLSFIFGITLINVSTITLGEELSACNVLLKKDIDVGSLNKVQKLAVLSQINKDDFDEKRSKVGAGASFIYYGIPVGANGNWDDFKASRDKETSLYKLNITNEEAWSWTKFTTPSAAYPAYQDCITKVLRQTGVFIKVHSESMSDNLYSTTFYWQAGEEDRKPRKAVIQVINGEMSNIENLVSGAKTEKTKDGWIIYNIVGSLTVPFVVTRNQKNEPVFVMANIDKAGSVGSTELIIPKIPTLKIQKITESRVFSNARTVTKSARQQFNGELCIPSEKDAVMMVDDWRFSSKPALDPIAIDNGGKGDPQYGSQTFDLKRACVNLAGGADDKEATYNCTAHFGISAPADKWEWKDADDLD